MVTKWRVGLIGGVKIHEINIQPLKTTCKETKKTETVVVMMMDDG